MKTTIGGDRLGSGNKQNVSLKNYSRSTHDLGYLWRSSMAAGTLVPFMNQVALPGDSFDIDLSCEVLTLPTIGPLFGSFKVQLDVFQVPMRLYIAALHMNKLGIGMDMGSVYLPILKILCNPELENPLKDNRQINPSSLAKYLGVSGLGTVTSDTFFASRSFNALPTLAYFDIYKQYYANKQEERGFVIHTDDTNFNLEQAIVKCELYKNNNFVADIYGTPTALPSPSDASWLVQIDFGADAGEPDREKVLIDIDGISRPITGVFDAIYWYPEQARFQCIINGVWGAASVFVPSPQVVYPVNQFNAYSPRLLEFPLSNIDLMREKLLQAPTDAPYYLHASGIIPYTNNGELVVIEGVNNYSVQFSQENLAIKTYQSDLLNNWISTEWIDGANGINEVTAVDTTGDSFTIDSLNLANKVYNMLNRIAISGGSYDDWLDAVYTHERSKGLENPVYLGSLIKELAFDAVVSNSAFEGGDGGQPLGQLAGKGKLTGKNKGGHIKVKVDEPSILMGLVSLTPRVDYSQGNEWHVNLKTMNDFHKPALDAIGYQDLITEQMAWQDTKLNYVNAGGVQNITYKSAGKQPAWINYMTAVNKTYGNFAIEEREMFMTLNRRYDIDQSTGDISDLTTYIDPVKFNQIFADTNLDAQNFWTQIKVDCIARRKMSAKVIPNL